MISPIDYSIDVQNPFQSALQGFQAGAGVRQVLDARAQAEAQRAAEIRRQETLSQLAANRNATAQDYGTVMTMYPELADNLGKAWTAMDSAQQKSELQFRGQVFTALDGGKPEIAADLLQRRADAKRNSGVEGADQDEMMAKLIELDPDTARVSVGTWLAGVPDGAKLIEAAQKLRLAPSELATAESGAKKAAADAGAAESDASIKAVKAKYADSEALLDLEKKGWDIKKIKEDIDIAKQNSRIAAMNAAIARESNDLKRQELQLKVQDAIAARETKIREKVAEAESGAASIDNMLNTIERIKNNPQLDNVVGSFEGRMPAAASAMDDEESDAIALIETLGSQAFLAQIPNIKGMGALSNAEGEKLQSALQSLSRAQSEKQFRANLEEAARLLTKGRQSLARSTGVPLGAPDTPAAKPAERPPLSSFGG